MTQLNQRRLEARADARKRAVAAIDLIVESLRDVADEDARLAFWDEVRGEVESRCCDLERQDPETGRDAMTDAERDRFLADRCPFKKHLGELNADVPLRYLDWLVAQREDPEDYVNRARRYLAREDVSELLKKELEDGHTDRR